MLIFVINMIMKENKYFNYDWKEIGNFLGFRVISNLVNLDFNIVDNFRNELE